LLHNIFLFKGKKLQDLEDLNIYCYPKEIINVNNKILVNNIIKGHDKGISVEDNKYLSSTSTILCKNSNHYIIDKPVAQFINDLNIYTSCIDESIIIGLIFDNDDNPYDIHLIFPFFFLTLRPSFLDTKLPICSADILFFLNKLIKSDESS